MLVPVRAGPYEVKARSEELPTDVVQYETAESIATITLNRPEKLNALNDDLWDGLEAALVLANRNRSVHVTILRGCRQSVLGRVRRLAGGKVGEVSGIRSAMDWWTGFERLVYRHMLVWNSVKPVIAQVHGYAISGADGLALACDFCLMDYGMYRIGIPVSGQRECPSI